MQLLLCIMWIIVLPHTALYSLRSNPVYITQSNEYHIVQEGETLYGISRIYSLPVQSLKLYNNLQSDEIIVGQKIYLTPQVKSKREYVTVRDIPQEGYHKVRSGETVYRLSRMYDLEIMDILSYNNLQSFDIREGQKIWLIPGQVETMEVSGEVVEEEVPAITDHDAEEYTYHTVAAGENLYRISLKYDMTVPRIKELNSLSDEQIYAGQRLKVSAREISEAKIAGRTSSPVGTDETIPEGSLILPVNGEVISEFGIRNNMPHNGIDIAAAVGKPILAALDGKVVFAGVQRGYGNVIVLEHKDFIMTVYAHNERNLVRLGDDVKQGQPIATVGQTGNASVPHLHFEYRRKGKAINPRQVLPEF